MQHDHEQPLYPYKELSQQPTKEALPMNPTTGALGALGAAATSPAAAKTLVGPENTVTTCPFCHASIKTAVKYTVTTRTHIAATLCCMICCCCCIPYCSNSAKNSDHYCPNCQKYLGTYEK